MQSRRRLDPELLDERLSGRPVRLECVGLPADAVEGKHELGPEPLPERMDGDQLLEPAYGVSVPTQGKPRVDLLLERRETEVLEPRSCELGERLVDEIGKR